MTNKKIFFDFEFTGLHRNTTPISFGAIKEDGSKFYYEFNDYNKFQIDEWLQKNVINNLNKNIPNDVDYDIGNRKNFKRLFLAWLGKKDIYEFYGDVIAHDWVLFIDLLADYFDGYPKLPASIYYIPFDLATLFKAKGIDPDISRAGFSEIPDMVVHNALHDAMTIKLCYDKLNK